MKTIQTLDRATVRAINARAQELLSQLEKEFNVKVAPGRCGFTAGNLTLQASVALVVDGEAQTKEAEAFKLIAEVLGFQASDFGREVFISGTCYKVAGYRAGASKRPILLTQANDKMRSIVAPTEMVLALLRNSAAVAQ